MISLKKRRTILAILLIFIMVFSLAACDDDNSENAELSTNRTQNITKTDETWAFYWYLCGSDLESEGAFASIDLEEMLEVDLPENVTVVIETGGAKEWWTDEISADYNSRLVYDSEGLSLIEQNPVANMGDPDTLVDFLDFCNENYPADRQAVIFWNHGAGSVGGAAYDELFDFDSLTLPEMRAAFNAADKTKNGKYEIIGFDTCLMATIDVVDTFGEFGNYLVASEELEPGGGWDYEAILEAVAQNPALDGAELGKIICDTYYASCKIAGDEDMVTLSVIDLSWTNDLLTAYNAIGTDALAGAGIRPSFHNEFGRAARNAENYGGNNGSQGYSNLVDIGDLVRQAGDELLPYSGEAMLSTLDSAVIYQVKGSLRSNASGISCYFNYDGDYDDYLGYAELNTSQSFIHYYDYVLTGEVSDDLIAYMSDVSVSYIGEVAEPKPIITPEREDLENFPLVIEEDGYVSLNLGPEIADSLLSVYANISYIDSEAGIAFVLGFDNDLFMDWEAGVFTDNFNGTWGSLDGELVYMELSDFGDDYQVYAVPVLLNGDEYTMLVSYIYERAEYDILGFRLEIDENGMASGNIRPLEPGDIIEPVHYVVDIESGEISELAIGRIVADESTSFYDIDLGDGDFMFMFEMSDIHNNSYLSEAVLFTVEDGEIYIY